jgi:hypothetical protein
MNKTVKIIIFVSFFFLIAISEILIFIPTHPLGVSPDSTVYIEVARNLVNGQGLESGGEPLIYYPPGYPVFLVLAIWLGGDVFPVANWLHAILYLFNGILIFAAVYFTSGRRFLPAFLATLIFFSSAAFFRIYSMAWSEPLYILLALAGSFFLGIYLDKKSLVYLILSGLCIGSAFFVRIIGFALVPAVCVCLVWFNGRPLKRKILDIGVFLLLACLPIGLFFINNLLVTESATHRALSVHFPEFLEAKILVTTLFDFLVPVDITRWVKLPCLLLLVGLIFWTGSRTVLKRERIRLFTPWIYCWLFGIVFITTHFCIYGVTISFIDASVILDNRNLSPVIIALLLMIYGAAWYHLSLMGKVWIQIILVALAVLSIGFNLPWTIRGITIWKNDGLGYTNEYFNHLEVIDKVGEIDPKIKIYSNGQDVLVFHTQKIIADLPEKQNPMSLLENPEYPREMEKLCADLYALKAVVVIIEAENWRWFHPSMNEINRYCGEYPMVEYDGGAIIGHRP